MSEEAISAPIVTAPAVDHPAITLPGTITNTTSHAGRFAAIDIAKAIGIVLVVFGHVWRGLRDGKILTDGALYARVDHWVYAFHMPLFFYWPVCSLSVRSLGHPGRS